MVRVQNELSGAGERVVVVVGGGGWGVGAEGRGGGRGHGVFLSVPRPHTQDNACHFRVALR